MKRIFPALNLSIAPWLVLACSLLMIFLVWRSAEKMILYKAEVHFQQEAESIESSIETRLNNYALMLRGCVGLFNASVSVERSEWRAFVQAIDPHKSYPGIQGIGFAKRVSAADREAHIRELRAEGFPDYTIHPPGDRAEYFPVIYLEPFKDRNLQALSYDMFSEDIRRAAMEKARDRGVATFSGKVTLVQETDKNIQPGFLMYLPLYAENRALITVKDRREALKGFVYSPFRAHDFINGLFKRPIDAIAWEVYDGTAIDSDAILYRSYASTNNTRPGAKPLFEKKAALELFGKTWTVYFKTLPAFEAAIDRSRLVFMVCASTLIGFLLFAVTFLVVSRTKTLNAELIRKKRDQEILQESEQRYRTIMEQASDAVFVHDETGHIMDVNIKACRNLGYSREELLAMTIADIDPEALRAEKNKMWKKILTGDQYTFESRQIRKDGSAFPVEVTLGMVSLPPGPAVLGIVRDITEQKKATEELRRASQSWRETFDAITDPIALLNPDGEIEKCNQAFVDFLGLDYPGVLGRKCHQLIHGTEEPIPGCPVVKAGKSGMRENMELRVGEKFFLVVADPVKDPGGKITAFVHIMTDITGSKAAEQALVQKNEELERFTYAVSHDLRSPLVTIQTFLDHLVQDITGGSTDQVAQDLAFITSAGKQMDALLNELQKFSKIGRVTNPSVKATLQEIAQEAIALVAGRIDKRGVRVQVAQEPVVLYGDRVRLLEVFQNLIDNAVKFMGEQSEPLIEIGAETKDGRAVCFVRDNGMGFEPRHKDKLFGLFEKLHPEMEGSGMGLALVKKIIETHGGGIRVESEGLCKGACFWFTLPQKSAES